MMNALRSLLAGALALALALAPLTSVDAAFFTTDGLVYSTPCTASGVTPQTCNGASGKVTTASLSTAAATNADYVINNNVVLATSRVRCNLDTYSGTIVTNGYPVFVQCKAGAGTITVSITNLHASNAMSGTVIISFEVSN